MQHPIRILLAAVTLLLLMLVPRPVVQSASAQEQLCFPNVPGITQCIDGRFRQYWEQNGGLPVFGYPITAAANEVNRDTGQPYLTQWFERHRFELHPENASPYDVLLGRLGVERLSLLGPSWQSFYPEAGPKAGCLWFGQTGHNVCNEGPESGFRTYWQTHGLRDPRLNAYGRSLALFGFPLTEPRLETNSSGDTVLTQWFERARFEWHPNNPAQFRVLLGLLGHEVRHGATAPRVLRYFWPTTLPRGLAVQSEQSSATESTFTLRLAQPGGQSDATISGGAGSEPSPLRAGGQGVTVRGWQGVAFSSGAGYSLFWTEDGQPFAIVSGLGLEDVLTLAEGLEALDLATFRQRIRPQ